MTHRVLSLGCCAMALVFLAGCSAAGTATAPAKADAGATDAPLFQDVEPDPIVIGVMPTGDALPLWVASREGLFEAEGVDVEIIVFEKAAERDAALAAGEIDALVSNLFSAAQAEASGHPVALVAVAVEPSLVATATDVPDRSLSGVGPDRTFLGVSDRYLALPSGLIATRAVLRGWDAAVARLQADPGARAELLIEVARLNVATDQVRVSAAYPLAAPPSRDVVDASLADLTARNPALSGVSYDNLVMDVGR